MNKRIKIIAFVLLIVALVFTLASCVGKGIDFKIEKVDVELNNKYDTQLTHFQMTNKIANVGEFERFFNNEYFGVGTAEKFTKFDDKYFENNTLIVVCFPKGQNERAEVVELKLKGDELFTIIERTYIAGATWTYSYFFVTVAKSDVNNINKLSYIIITI